MRKNILVIGSFMMDMVVRTRRAPEAGETVMGESFGRSPGGKGANQAVAAARLGGTVTMAGMLGGDAFGQEMRAVVANEGIDTSHVMTAESGESTGIGSIVVDDAGQNRIIVVPGANMSYKPEEVDRLEPVIRTSDMLVMQLEVDMEVVERAAEIAHRHGVPVILNPAPAQSLSDTLLSRVTYLTPNETELELLTGIAPTEDAKLKQAVDLLLQRGVRHVIVTLGERGACYAEGDGELRYVAGFPVRAVDTVAAGDSFNGALAVRLALGEPMDDAIRYANAAGALAVTRPGAIAALPSRDELEQFMAAHSREETA